jgi:hypothetical protein
MTPPFARACAVLLLLWPAVGRAELVTFDYTGSTSQGGPVSGSFSYETGHYGSGAGSISLTAGGITYTSVSGQPIDVHLEPGTQNRVMGVSAPMSLPAGFSGSPTLPPLIYLNLEVLPGFTFSDQGPPSSFQPGSLQFAPAWDFNDGSLVRASAFSDAQEIKVNADIQSVTARGPVNETPEPGALLLGGMGAALLACRLRKSTRRYLS